MMSATRRKNAAHKVEQELRARLEQQAAVAELGRRALAGADIQTLLEEAVRVVAERLNVGYGEVLELLPGEMRLILRAGVGWEKEIIGNTILELNGGSQIDSALLADEPVIVSDLREEKRFVPPRFLTEHGVISCISVRIEGRDRPYGALCAHSTERREFTRDDAHFLKTVANVLSSAITRRRDEDALRKWYGVFEHANWGVVIGGSDGRTLEMMNPAFARMHGYTVAELTGEPIVKVFAPECRADVAHHIRASHEKGHHVWESVHLRKDGSKFPVLINVTALNDEMERHSHRIVSVQDITERKEAEDKLRQSEQRLRDVIDGMFAFVGMLTPEGTLIEANRSALQVAGLHPDDVIGTPFEQTYWWSGLPEEQERLREAMRRGVRGEASRFDTINRIAEDRFINVDFMLAPVLDGQGRVTHLIPSAVDITERKLSEKTIRRQAALLDIVPDAILVRDLDDRIIYWNRGAECLYGWTADEAMGRNANELLCREEQARLDEAGREVVASGVWSGELHQVTKCGADLIVQSRWALVRDELGRPAAKLVVNTDITEKRRLEMELLRASQLSIIGELAACLAHEIKNPLAGIKGAMDILIRRQKSEDPEREVLEDVRHAVERIDGTVRALLDRARRRPPELARESINEVVRSAVRIARHHAAASVADGREVSVLFEPPADAIVLTVDAAQIEDAVLNLILNGVEAVEGAGRVIVRVRRSEAEEGGALIEVEDDGRGIAEEDLERMFDAFYTTGKKGTGLGLPAVRRIAQAHGGSVKVHSTLGRGSTFTMYLPA